MCEYERGLLRWQGKMPNLCQHNTHHKTLSAGMVCAAGKLISDSGSR